MSSKRHCYLKWLLCLALFTHAASAQEPSTTPRSRLSREHYKDGEETLRAFESIARAARQSVVKLESDGEAVAFATVIDSGGLAVTKASELEEGELIAWLASGKRADVKLLGRDKENDVALLRIQAEGLKPVQWARGNVMVGQWVVTPGLGELPEAVGIVSVPPRKILHPRALIGVELDLESSGAVVDRVMPGLGADKAGLRSRDIIVAVNGKTLEEGETLPSRLRQFREGQNVKLRVKRGDREFDASVEMMLPRREGRAGRSERMNQMGSLISERSEGFELALQHDSVLEPAQCGGPVLNLDGKAIGINIARAGRIASYALSGDVVKRTARALRAQAEVQ